MMTSNTPNSMSKNTFLNPIDRKEFSTPFATKTPQSYSHLPTDDTIDGMSLEYGDIPRKPKEFRRSSSPLQRNPLGKIPVQIHEEEQFSHSKSNVPRNQVGYFDQQRELAAKSREMSLEMMKNYGLRNSAVVSTVKMEEERAYAERNSNPKLEKPIIVLMVAEKPSIARSIAYALSNGRYRSRKGISGISIGVLEYEGEIFGKRALFRVTSVVGHIYCRDFPPEYQDWKLVDPFTLFQAPTIKRETAPETNIIEHLKLEAKDASYLVLWLDFDREGENICFEVVENVKDCLLKENFRQIFRAKFSSIVPDDLRRAFNELNDGPNLNESLAVDARQEIDLKIGVAFSRFQTGYLHKRYEIDTKIVTYGPCQTPALGFCVERQDEIINFKSEAFYRVIPVINLPNGEVLELHWVADRTPDQKEAERVRDEIMKIGRMNVVEAKGKDGRRERPEALNTVHMLKMSSSLLGFGPEAASTTAEKLYLKGYITYPRTESTSYPKNFDHNGVVTALTRVSLVSGYATELLHGGINGPKLGKDVGDHPPITPTTKVPLINQLEPDELKLYELVARHYLATVSQDAKFFKKNALFKAGPHEFSATGTALISKGFTEIVPWVKIHDNHIPNFQQGEAYQIVNVEVNAGKTTPPDYLTESDLITLMEKNGIGTDASMAQHINNICKRCYVAVVGNTRKLKPTMLGSSLIHAYKLIDPDIAAPNLRMRIEQSVDMIARGLMNHETVLKEVLTVFSEKFIYFRENISHFDTIFGGQFTLRKRPERHLRYPMIRNEQSSTHHHTSQIAGLQSSSRFYVDRRESTEEMKEEPENQRLIGRPSLYYGRREQSLESPEEFKAKENFVLYSNGKEHPSIRRVEYPSQNQKLNDNVEINHDSRLVSRSSIQPKTNYMENQNYTGKNAPYESPQVKGTMFPRGSSFVQRDIHENAYQQESPENRSGEKEILGSRSKKIKKDDSPNSGPIFNKKFAKIP